MGAVLVTLLFLFMPVDQNQSLTKTQQFNLVRNKKVAMRYYKEHRVGFQPVISILPDGTNMQASVVVSADRRYVRICTNPIFSSVTSVNTFNFTTGK